MSKSWDKSIFWKVHQPIFSFMIGWVANSEIRTAEADGDPSVPDEIQDVVTWPSWDSATISKGATVQGNSGAQGEGFLFA